MGAGGPAVIITAIQEAIKAESVENNLLDQTYSDMEPMQLSEEQAVVSLETLKRCKSECADIDALIE